MKMMLPTAKKSDFAKQSQFFRKLKKQRHILSAATIYFCSAWAWRGFRQTCGFSNSNPAGRFRFGFPTGAFTL